MVMIMVIIMTMIMVNIHEAKAKLSEYLEAVARGERVLICKRNRPVAELRAVGPQRDEPRPVGLAKGQVTIPPSFFDPMPDEWLDAFYNSEIFPSQSGKAPAAPKKRKRSR
jgi:antitoxin (DNA-binding transcriptional repressor) of toxin-antitoxin stability system